MYVVGCYVEPFNVQYPSLVCLKTVFVPRLKTFHSAFLYAKYNGKHLMAELELVGSLYRSL